MANSAELNLCHQIDDKNTIEFDETKLANSAINNTIILTHQINNNLLAQVEVDTNSGVKTGIINYNINKDTTLEIDKTNKGQTSFEVNVKI